MDERIVLGIHSNIAPDSNADLTDGHAWISVTRGGRTQTYGLWPDEHPYIQRHGLDNGEGSDIRTGIESGIGREPAASRYYELTLEQFRALQGELARDVEWGYTNTCASWASGVASRVTGERISASELLGVTDTPRQLSESIQELERGRRTDRTDPVGPAEIPDRSSSFSMNDSGVDLDRHPVARELRARLPESVSDARIAHAAVRAIDAGIDDPAKIAGIVERNGDLHVAGTVPGFRVTVGAQEPAGDTETLNRQLLERSQQVAHAAQPDSPALRIA